MDVKLTKELYYYMKADKRIEMNNYSCINFDIPVELIYYGIKIKYDRLEISEMIVRVTDVPIEEDKRRKVVFVKGLYRNKMTLTESYSLGLNDKWTWGDEEDCKKEILELCLGKCKKMGVGIGWK